jgi:hypothetical protein
LSLQSEHVGEMVEVGLGVSVGWANAVWVKPTATVLTTEVSISSMLIVGVSSGAAAPQALNTKVPRKARVTYRYIFPLLFTSNCPFKAMPFGKKILIKFNTSFQR